MKYVFSSRFAVVAALAISACAPAGQPAPTTGDQVSALTEDQCLFFDQNGKDLICHATHSARNPFVLIRVS